MNFGWKGDLRHYVSTCETGDSKTVSQSSFAIDPSGMLRACVLSRGDTYDLRKGSFQEGWENFLLKVRQKKITRQTKCVACEIKARCWMCPANGELESGDAEEPGDSLCPLAPLRAHALGLPVPQHGDCEYCQKTVQPLRHKEGV